MQAEDGIRDYDVTGVQTCALPIFKYSLGREEPNAWIESAVESVLAKGVRTRDIMSPGMKEVGTQTMGDLVAEELEKKKNGYEGSI